jgi:hypothetical protein
MRGKCEYRRLIQEQKTSQFEHMETLTCIPLGIYLAAVYIVSLYASEEEYGRNVIADSCYDNESIIGPETLCLLQTSLLIEDK